MTALISPVLVGRSSSHFTRIARIFAHELEVAYEFQPVLDLTSVNRADYADNPTLRVPILRTEAGTWFGALNICRALARRVVGNLRRRANTSRANATSQEIARRTKAGRWNLLCQKWVCPDCRSFLDNSPCPTVR